MNRHADVWFDYFFESPGKPRIFHAHDTLSTDFQYRPQCYLLVCKTPESVERKV